MPLLLLLALLMFVPSFAFSQTINARQSGTWNLTNVTGTITLPTGAATESTLSTLLASSTFTGRFPAAFASSDAIAAQTATMVHGGMMGWNGTGWDRLQVDGSKNLKVAVQNTSLASTQSGTWTMQPGNTANTTPWLFSISQGGNTAAVNASSQLSVNCANCSGSGVSQQDNTGFTPGTTNFVPMGGEVDDTATTAVAENSAGAARITAQRAVHMNLRNNSGTEIGTSGAPIRTDPTGSTTQPVSGTVTVTQGTGTNLHIVCDSGCSGSGGTSSNFGSAFPTPGTAAGFTDGTNMVAGRVVTSTPGTSDAGLVVRPINPNLAADNSTNSTNKVPVLVGVATTAAPTYTTTNQVPLSLTIAGGLRVDGSAVTQPVSGTVTANAGTNLNTSALLTTSAHDAAFGTAGAADTQVRTIQGIAGMTAVKVDGSAVTQPVSGTVTANAGTGNFTVTQATGTNLHMVCDSGCSSSAGFADNGAFTFGTTAINPIGGVFDDTASNTATENSAAVARITQNKALHTNLRNASGAEIGTSGTPIRTDPTGTTPQPASQSGTWTVQPGNTANTTPWLVKPHDGTNAGTIKAASTAAGATDTALVVAVSPNNSVAVTQATAANLNVRPDTSGATGAAPPARANFTGGLGSGATGGFLTGFAVCDSFVNVNVSAATTTALITGVAGRHVRICGMNLVTLAANNVALISGTGATCGTGTTGMNGGTTASSGWNFAANGGLTQGNGLGTINQTNATGDSVCIVTSAATQLSGRIAYTIY